MQQKWLGLIHPPPSNNNLIRTLHNCIRERESFIDTRYEVRPDANTRENTLLGDPNLNCINLRERNLHYS